MTESFAKIADLFKSGRNAHSDAGTAIDVSSNGTTTVRPDSLAEILRARFAELNSSNTPADARADHDVAVGNK